MEEVAGNVVRNLVNKVLPFELESPSSEIEELTPELEKQLFEIKKRIADKYAKKVVEKHPFLLPFKDQISLFFVNDGSSKQALWNVFREHSLYTYFQENDPEEWEHLSHVKKLLDGLTNIPTSEALEQLKSEIMDSTSIDSSVSDNTSTTDASIGDSSSQKSTDSLHNEQSSDGSEEGGENGVDEGIVDSSTETYSGGSQDVPDSVEVGVDEQSPFIENVYKTAVSQLGVKYTWGGTSPETGFDCSGFWNWTFKQQGIKFKGRLTAAAFSDADVDIQKDQVKPGDFMYWDQKPGKKKKHSPIYHIEMVISKPFVKNGKTYVRTLGCSTDSKDDCGNRVGRGVSIRVREMKDYRHFGRPPYYYQLAQYEKTGQKEDLVATANKPSSDIADKVVA